MAGRLTQTRTRVVATVAVAAGCALPALIAAPGSGVAAAATQTVTVPRSVGKTAVKTWTGTIPAGANANSNCAGAQNTMSHKFTLSVPSGVYSKLVAHMNVAITWTPIAGPEDTSDEILTLVGPNGKVISSSDGSTTKEQVTLLNPRGGTYTAIACGFVNPHTQDFKGTVTVSAEKLPGWLLGDSHGVQFSATVPPDPQRDEGEPAIPA